MSSALAVGVRLAERRAVAGKSRARTDQLRAVDQYGCAVDEPFVINLADAPAIGAPRGATFIKLEPDAMSWPDTGVNVQVMQPGEPSGRYHSEPVQEDFLVLHGQCIAIVDDNERTLRQWDFLHCPGGTDHVFVGAGNGPCAVLMIGSRRENALHYPVNATAARYGASVSKETNDPAEAYADWRAEGPDVSVANPWPIG